MKQRPIIFNTEMVRAILDGRKTQTRRPMNPQPEPDTETTKGGYWFPCRAFQSMVHVEDLKDPLWRGMASDACPICSVGDQLWVRETLTKEKWPDLHYVCGGLTAGTGDEDFDYRGEKYRGEIPSIHMPRWAARIFLEVTDVRVERLNDISEQDAKAEGFEYPAVPGMGWKFNARHNFLVGWDQIYGNRSSNPWVWVIEFKVISTTGDKA